MILPDAFRCAFPSLYIDKVLIFFALLHERELAVTLLRLRVNRPSIPVKVLALGLDIIEAIACFTLSLTASSLFLAGSHIGSKIMQPVCSINAMEAEATVAQCGSCGL